MRVINGLRIRLNRLFRGKKVKTFGGVLYTLVLYNIAEGNNGWKIGS